LSIWLLLVEGAADISTEEENHLVVVVLVATEIL